MCRRGEGREADTSDPANRLSSPLLRGSGTTKPLRQEIGRAQDPIGGGPDCVEPLNGLTGQVGAQARPTTQTGPRQLRVAVRGNCRARSPSPGPHASHSAPPARQRRLSSSMRSGAAREVVKDWLRIQPLAVDGDDARPGLRRLNGCALPGDRVHHGVRDRRELATASPIGPVKRSPPPGGGLHG
jgi:hypothetical protein